MSLEVHVIVAPWADHADTLRALREVVFIEEQEVPREIEWDGQDETSTHFLAVDELGRYLGCARLLPSGQIGRMAVLKEARGKRIGARLLEAAVAEGREQGFERLYLHAQSYAEDFYHKGGFVRFGDLFEEAGIEHVAMELKLPLTFTSPGATAKDTSGPVVRTQPVREQLHPGAPQPRPFDTLEGCKVELLRVIGAARRRLVLLNPFLDHDLFDQEETVEALSNLARSAPRAEIRILICDSKLIVDRGHRILELARRLDQKISIRRIDERPHAETASFACADLDAYWLMPSFENYAGVADLVNPVTTKRLAEGFTRAWEKSRDDPELRIIRL